MLIMKLARVGFSLLALLFPLFLHASHFIKNDLLSIDAAKVVEEIGDELSSKTGINAYAIATNENFTEGFNLVNYVRQHEGNMSKPYVVLVFAPNAVITVQSQEKGRVAVVPSSDDLKELYDTASVIDDTVDVVAAKDSNTKQDKYAIGVVQGYSQLAQNIADSKGVQMTKTLPSETRTIVTVLQYFVYLGTILVFWIFLIRPIVKRARDGRAK